MSAWTNFDTKPELGQNILVFLVGYEGQIITGFLGFNEKKAYVIYPTLKNSEHDYFFISEQTYWTEIPSFT